MSFDYNVSQNPHSFFEYHASHPGVGFTTKWKGWASECIGKQFPEFDDREVVSVWVKNSSGVVFQKNYLSLAEFQAESSKYQSRVPLSKAGMAFTVNRVNSITNFVTDLLFPLSAKLHRSYYSGQVLWFSQGQAALEIFGSVLIDVATIFARVVTLPYRLATVRLERSHLLFKELADEGNHYDDNLMVFITAHVDTDDVGHRVIKLAYPLFMSNMNEYIDSVPYENKIYYSSQTIFVKRPDSKPAGSKPSVPSQTETQAAAFKFFGMDATSPWKAIKKKYNKLSLTCHPDKCPNDPQAQAEFIKLNDHFAVLKKHYKKN